MSHYAPVDSRDLEHDLDDDDDDLVIDGHEREAHTAGEVSSLLPASLTSTPGSQESKKKAHKLDGPDVSGKGTRRLTLKTAPLIIAFCVIAGLYLADLLRADEAQTDADGDDLTVTNYYTERDGDFASGYPWSDQYLMVEPHITTTLRLSSAVYTSLGEDVQWEIEHTDGSYTYPTGRIVTASFNDTGFRAVRYASASSLVRRRRKLAVAVGCGDTDSKVWTCLPKRLERLIARSSGDAGSSGGSSDASGRRLTSLHGQRQGRRPPRLVVSPARGSNAPVALLSTSSIWTEVHVQCVYVRRELRTLTKDDRDAFFDAAEVLFRTPTAEGQALYGSKYYGIGTLAMDHNVLAGNTDCDHMHDGLGFLTNHGAQTVQFEQALQSVNPRASVPYWDYTIDMTAFELSGDITSFYGSTIFESDFFGSAQTIIRSDSSFDDDGVVSGLVDPSGRILSGRFTQVEVSASYWGEESGPVQNAYGHIRSPWNNNNDPYVNRFNMTYGFSAVGGGDPYSRRKLIDLHADIAKRRQRRLAEETHSNGDYPPRQRQLLQTKDQEAQDAGKHRKGTPGARRGSHNERRHREQKAKDRKIGKKGHRELRAMDTENEESTVIESARLKKGRQRRLEGSSLEFGSADCGTVYDAMQYTSWYDFGKKFEYQPHGPIHTLIGGTHGADYKSTITGIADIEAYLVEAWSLLVFGIFKDMWRAGEVVCPTSCSADTSVEDCKCSCPDLDQWTVDDSTAKAKLVALDYAIWSNDEFTTDSNGNDVSAIILKTICNSYDGLSPVIGESLQSSSPLDITFWPTHPNVDRLFHWKRISTGFGDSAWGPNGLDVDGSCYGHSKNDKLIWKNLFDDSDYYYTNGELYDIFDPTTEDAEDYQLPYVYDTFLWEHCEDMGYPATLFDSDHGGPSDDEGFVEGAHSGSGDLDDHADDDASAGDDSPADADDYE